MTLRDHLNRVSLAGGQRQEATRNVLRAVADWLTERGNDHSMLAIRLSHANIVAEILAEVEGAMEREETGGGGAA